MLGNALSLVLIDLLGFVLGFVVVDAPGDVLFDALCVVLVYTLSFVFVIFLVCPCQGTYC